MKLLKNICITIAVMGFILALGLAGTSDLEMETSKILMTDTQFFYRMLTAITMLVIGSLGVKVCNVTIQHKRHRRALRRAYKTAHNQHKRVANMLHNI
ncbi:MAG: hypothetical protein RSE07_04370 [Oscillospiraceae bacterium]